MTKPQSFRSLRMAGGPILAVKIIANGATHHGTLILSDFAGERRSGSFPFSSLGLFGPAASEFHQGFVCAERLGSFGRPIRMQLRVPAIRAERPGLAAIA